MKPHRFSLCASFRQTVLLGFICLAAAAWGSTEYYRHVIFDNSLTPDSYFYSLGMANGCEYSGIGGLAPAC